jgi:hypothetical protein
MRSFIKISICFAAASHAILLGCSSAKDNNPQPGTVSEKAVQVVKKQFPEAADVVFKPMPTERVWEVSFRTAQDNYRGAVDTAQFLSRYRPWQGGLPPTLDALKSSLAIANCEFGNFREYLLNPTRWPYKPQFTATIQWPGAPERYTLKYLNDADANFEQYFLAMPEAEIEYEIMADQAPEKIKNFIAARIDPAKFLLVAARNPDGKYFFFNDSGLLFNDAYEPVLSVLGKYETYYEWNVFPEHIRNYVASQAELANFTYQAGGKFDDGPYKSYYMLLRREIGRQLETFVLFLDMDGKLLFKSYRGAINRQ